jgi:hypothetical protein
MSVVWKQRAVAWRYKLIVKHLVWSLLSRYFSIKHSSGDFTRPAKWNAQLGVGQHAQIVEVELQREYEGKAS